jgi:modulator of FtsH protease HflC
MAETLRNYRYSLFAAVLFILLLVSSFVVVSEDQQAVILRMGQADRVVNRFKPGAADGAGIAVKLPLIEQVTWVPRGLITFSHASRKVRSQDQQWLLVDTDITYRIIDPVRLVGSLGGADKVGAQLGALLPAVLDQELTQRTAGEIARPGATGATSQLLRALDARTRTYGVQIVDVRIARVALADDSLGAAYERMRKRQERVVFEIKSKSAADAAAITSAADLEAAAILQRSAGQDPEFYSFFKSMRSYETLYGDPKNKNRATIVVPPDSAYLKHFNGM